MKKIFVVVALLAVIVFSFAGCGQKATVNVQSQGVKQQAQKGQGANFNTPEFKLRHELTSLLRLQRGDSTLSKEQAQKLIAIINDIKAKDTIDEAYANQQYEAINAVLTDEQKNSLNTRPQRGNNPGQNGQNPNIQQNGQNAPKNGQKGNGNGQMGRGQQTSLKNECTRVLEELQKIQ